MATGGMWREREKPKGTERSREERVSGREEGRGRKGRGVRGGVTSP